MSKPLHLQQTRFQVRPCRVSSPRAQGGYAVNYWYIHDTETDEHESLPVIDRHRAFSTRRDAVQVLNRRLSK